MSLNDWILALHLLAAFAMVGAQVVFNAMIVTLWRTDSTRKVASFVPVSRLATVLVLAGTAGTVVSGVWLSITREPYDPWDAWIVASLVLWAVAGGLGARVGKGYGGPSLEAVEQAEAGTERDPRLAETFGASQTFWLHVASNVVIVVILVLMIWKPGA